MSRTLSHVQPWGLDRRCTPFNSSAPFTERRGLFRHLYIFFWGGGVCFDIYTFFWGGGRGTALRRSFELGNLWICCPKKFAFDFE